MSSSAPPAVVHAEPPTIYTPPPLSRPLGRWSSRMYLTSLATKTATDQISAVHVYGVGRVSQTRATAHVLLKGPSELGLLDQDDMVVLRRMQMQYLESVERGLQSASSAILSQQRSAIEAGLGTFDYLESFLRRGL